MTQTTKLPILQAYTVSLRGTDECDCAASSLAREKAIIFQREHPVIHNSVQLDELINGLHFSIRDIKSPDIKTMTTGKPHGITISCHKGWRLVFVLDINVKDK